MAASSPWRRVFAATLAALVVTACEGQAADETPRPDSEAADEVGRDAAGDADAAGDDSHDADEASNSDSPASAPDESNAADVPDDLCAIVHSNELISSTQTSQIDVVELEGLVRQMSHNYRALVDHLDGEDATTAGVIADATWDAADLLRLMIDQRAIDWDELEASAPFRVVDEAFEHHPVHGLSPTALATVDEACGLDLLAQHHEAVTTTLLGRTIREAALEMEFYFNDHFEYDVRALDDFELPPDAELTAEVRSEHASFCLTLELPLETNSGEESTLLGAYDSAAGGYLGIVEEPC